MQNGQPPAPFGRSASSAAAAATATDPPERSHRHGMETLAKVASLICAAGAGIGAATGLMSPEDGVLTGIIVPVTAGAVLATAIACGWQSIHTAAVRVRTPLSYVAVTAAGLALSAATIGASSWAIATVLSGHAAMRQHMSVTATQHQQALDAAWAQARGEAAMIDAVSTANAELRAMSEMEASGGIVSKHGKGSGPNSAILAAGADGYARLAEAMRSAQDDAVRIYAQGSTALGQMRASVHADPEAYSRATAAVETAVAALNAFRLTDLANKAGLINVEVWSQGDVVQSVRSGAEKVSEKVLHRGKEIAQARQMVAVPVYAPLEPREATWTYAGGAAAGGWITAIAIDLIPFLFAGLLLGTQAPGRLDEPVPQRKSDDGERRSGEAASAAAPAQPMFWPRPVRPA